MIKFFRHIRKSLLMENKTTKYFKYAIGEIVLVVIGILIALQINNWNQNRVSKLNEIKTLNQLNVDLKSNLIEIIELDSLMKIRSNAGKKILNHFKNNENVTDSLRYFFERFNGRNIFNNANTTYKNIENSKSNIISNDSLRMQITYIYETVFANIHHREQTLAEDHFKFYKMELFKNFKAGSVKLKVIDGQTLSINTPKDYKSLRKNEEYKTALIYAINFRLMRQFWLSKSLSILKALIKDVEKEIKTLQE